MSTPLLQIDLRDRRTGATTRHTFHAAPVRIGRDPASELCLADSLVSSHHAVVDVDASGARLRDLGSKNGLYVAGRRTAPNAAVVITRRLCAEIGPFHLEIAHRPNPDRHAAHGALPSSRAPDLDLLHAHLTRLHGLHAPLAVARQAFESALADALHALADDPAATRRLLAEFPSTQPSTSTPRDFPNLPPPTPAAPPAILAPPAPALRLVPPDLSRRPPPTLHLVPSKGPSSAAPDLSQESSAPAPRAPSLDLSHEPPSSQANLPHDSSAPAPRAPSLDLSHEPSSPRADLSHEPPSLRADLPHEPSSPAPRAHALDLSPEPSPALPPVPRPRRAPPPLAPTPAPSLLALLAPLAHAVLPGERPPATADEARRFLDRVTRVLRDLAAGVAALQHLRIQQTRGFDLTAAGPDNPVLAISRGDELLAHLLAWRGPADTTAHELMDCFAVLLAHLRGHVHAAMTTACHFADHLAPAEIQRRTRFRGPLRSLALWRTYCEQFRTHVGELATPVLKDTFKNAYRAELAELGVHLLPRRSA